MADFLPQGFMLYQLGVCDCRERFSRLNTQRFFWVSNAVDKTTTSVQSVLNIKLYQQSTKNLPVTFYEQGVEIMLYV